MLTIFIEIIINFHTFNLYQHILPKKLNLLSTTNYPWVNYLP